MSSRRSIVLKRVAAAAFLAIFAVQVLPSLADVITGGTREVAQNEPTPMASVNPDTPAPSASTDVSEPTASASHFPCEAMLKALLHNCFSRLPTESNKKLMCFSYTE
jgi:hypothetical protein